jgi:hypothetical protein
MREKLYAYLELDAYLTAQGFGRAGAAQHRH